ncbi:hypothetical protein DM860_011630 [Cuscuta australis]|uniref:Retrotransposon gag domain-containing protein n=1 Tax=Cuscuta australis TaxID=267555 RepID=A0A328D0X7_9ASTE|nr:hypothetical protein DM860_011630 [Cuscuta australis]
MPLQAPMAVTPFQTPMPQPSPFQPQLVSTMATVNLTGALNAAGLSRPPQGTNPAHKKKKGKNIRPATSRNTAFERLGDREEGQRKSAKQRLGQSVAHVSAFARLGEEDEAESQPGLLVASRLTVPNDRVQQMEAKLERLEKKVGEKNDRDKPLAGSPFTTRVHLTPFPRKVKIDAPRFTGKEDPEIHLDSFNQSVTMNGCTDEEKCLLFFQTLRNRATEWFNKLRPGSIESFSDLASKFKAKFQENYTKRKKFTYLSTAGQRESENLTQFLIRWKEEVEKVEEMDDKTVLSLLNGLRAGELYKEFYRKPRPRIKRPTTLHGSLLRLKLNSGRRRKPSMVTSPNRFKSRRKKHRDLAGRGTTMTRSSVWSIRKNAKKSGKHRSFLRKTLPVKQGGSGRAPIVRTTGQIPITPLNKAQEKSHQWVRPAAPGDDRDNDRRRNNWPRERQPAPEKEHIGMIFGGPKGGDSAAQRKN